MDLEASAGCMATETPADWSWRQKLVPAAQQLLYGYSWQQQRLPVPSSSACPWHMLL
jgi:hypothetical protein